MRNPKSLQSRKQLNDNYEKFKEIERKELKTISGGIDKCYDLRESPDDPCQELNNQNNGCYRIAVQCYVRLFHVSNGIITVKMAA